VRDDHLDRIDRFARAGLVLGLVWFGVAAPVPVFPDPMLPRELTGVPGVTIDEFFIDGTTLPAIRKSLWDRRILDGSNSDGASAVTYPHLSWDDSGTFTSADGCRLAHPNVEIRFRVLLPRLGSSGYSREVGMRWHLFRRSVEQHEARHVLVALDGARRLATAFAETDCADVAKVSAKIVADMERAQNAIDAETCRDYDAGDNSQRAVDLCGYPYLDERYRSVAVQPPSA